MGLPANEMTCSLRNMTESSEQQSLSAIVKAFDSFTDIVAHIEGSRRALIHAANRELAHLKEQTRNVRDERERLEGELSQAYAQIESEVATRLTPEDRCNNLLSTV